MTENAVATYNPTTVLQMSTTEQNNTIHTHTHTFSDSESRFQKGTMGPKME
jgi:hypothetical protein